MRKKSTMTIEAAITLLLVIFVVIALISYGPRIWDLIRAGIGFVKQDTSNINDKIPITKVEVREVNGKLEAVVTRKMEDQDFESKYKIDTKDLVELPKPTSPNYCSVGTVVTNTGQTTWESSDKIRITLFCDHQKSQESNTRLVVNYPINDYVTNLKPGEQRQVSFAGRFPNHCIESLETYQIILYSNCEGRGTLYKPCDNFGEAEESKRPKILEPLLNFKCETN